MKQMLSTEWANFSLYSFLKLPPLWSLIFGQHPFFLKSIFGYFLPPISDFLSNEIGAILAPSCLFMFLFLFSEYSTYSYGVRVKAPGPLCVLNHSFVCSILPQSLL